MIRDYIFFNEKSSKDFNAYITDAGVYDSGIRNYELVSIPGRNGDVVIEKNKFDNVTFTYPAVIVDDFDKNYMALNAFLSSQRGYKRLSDSFHPDEYYMAVFKAISGQKHALHNAGGTFKIEFERKPQRYLKSGEGKKTFMGSGALKNPTLYTALPMIRAYGTGSFTINGVTVQITSANSYTDIDCELQEAYKGTTNCNGNIELISGEFPSLAPGENHISKTGITSIELIPRWWTI